MVIKNKDKQAINNLYFLMMTKNVKHIVAVNNSNNCHFEIYRLNNFPNGKLEKK